MLIRKHFYSLSVALKYSENLSDYFSEIQSWVEMGENGIFSVIYQR